jgi:photosystem II stability/assembly factor-like uncharacterized protein
MKKSMLLYLIVPSLVLSQWVNLYNQYDVSLYEGVDVLDSNTAFISGVHHVLKTSNAGVNWLPIFTVTNAFFREVYFLNINTGFVIRTNGSVYKTTNGGLNWNGVMGNAMRIDMVDSLHGFLSTMRNVYRTTNGGNSWQQTTYHPSAEWDGFGLDFINRDTGYFGVSSFVHQAHILKTTNHGISWIDNNLGSPSFVTGISMCDQYTGYAVTTSEIYKTTNGSFDFDSLKYWFGVGSGMWDIHAINPDTVYIAAAQGIIKTTNGGENWILYMTANNDHVYGIDMLNSVTGFAVGHNGSQVGSISKTTNGGYVIGIEPISGLIPREYGLFQNYPNPFNPETTIRFSIPITSFAAIRIYDVLGRFVHSLVEEQLTAGNYSVSWNASEMPSGIYFYRIESGNFSESKKMILVK